MALRDFIFAATVGVVSGAYIWQPYLKDMEAMASRSFNLNKPEAASATDDQKPQESDQQQQQLPEKPPRHVPCL